MGRMSGTEERRLARLRNAARIKQNNLCYWCDEAMNDVHNDPLQCTGDHLFEWAKGGRTIDGNVVAACKRCNSTRSKGGIVKTVGDQTPRSPFEVLAALWPPSEDEADIAH